MQQVIVVGLVLIAGFGYFLYRRYTPDDDDEQGDFESDEGGRRRKIRHEAGI